MIPRRMRSNIRNGSRWLILGLTLLWPSAAAAAVEISFHSRAFGSSFPHALIMLRGTLDATGEPIDASYGFTVRHQIGPSVLFGPVQGHITRHGGDYVAGTRRHFSLQLSDEQYARVIQLVVRWQALPQPSYHLDRRNCVTFVAAVATELGLSASTDRATIRRPRAFLDRVEQANRQRIAEWMARASSSSASPPGAGR